MALLVRVLLVAALPLTLGAAGVSTRPAPSAPVPIPAAVLARALPGDLVFREGTEAVSDLVRMADHGSWSHVGMLVHGARGWQVIHAVPAERRGRKDAVVIDDLSWFQDSRRARALAVVHLTARAAQRRRAVAFARAHLGQAFGFAPGQTYCTKFVWSAWQHAGVDLHVYFSTLHLPFLPGRYLLPSGLLAAPRLQVLWSSADPSARAATPAKRALVSAAATRGS